MRFWLTIAVISALFLYGITCYRNSGLAKKRGLWERVRRDAISDNLKAIKKNQKDKLKSCQEKEPKPKDDDYEKQFFDFLDECVREVYTFGQEEMDDGYKISKFPNLDKEVIRHEHFSLVAKVADAFFKQHTWGLLMQKYKKEEKCKPLVQITMARYLYVTDRLNEASKENEGGEGNLQQCVVKSGKIIVPEGVCFPYPVGSALCTSDYDVGLVGPESGSVTARFNDDFQKDFGWSSEKAFDTNIYAFSLEYAMPQAFDNKLLDKDFQENVKKMERNFMYQEQDVVSALWKIKKFDEPYFQELLKIKNDDEAVEIAKSIWVDFYEKEEAKFKDKGIDYSVREQANKAYSSIVEEISKGTTAAKSASKDAKKVPKPQFVTMYLQSVSLALIYAAEAYHTRGAMRYVVGGMQMKNDAVIKGLTALDRLVTFIENWGDTMKEFHHLQEKPVNEALVKMSKYLVRTFKPMDELYKENEKNKGKADFEDVTEVFNVIKQLYEIKQKGGKVIPEDKVELITKFEEALDCKTVAKVDPESSLPKKCMDNAFEKVKKYYTEAINKRINWDKST